MIERHKSKIKYRQVNVSALLANALIYKMSNAANLSQRIDYKNLKNYCDNVVMTLSNKLKHIQLFQFINGSEEYERIKKYMYISSNNGGEFIAPQNGTTIKELTDNFLKDLEPSILEIINAKESLELLDK